MKKLISFSLLTLPAFLLLFCTASTTGKKQNDSKTESTFGAKNGFAVIELFTSQGCSSCPPADRLLGKYSDKENVFALSFHVDYWNRLGWKDPFSTAAFTERQQNYVSSLNASGVYTPQVFVNGQYELVGSDEDKMATYVRKSQQEEPASQIVIDKVNTTANNITFNYAIHNFPPNVILNAALVQNKITTSIKAGENRGVTLTNYNVVRNFKTIDPKTEAGTITLETVEGVDRSLCSIIVFLQDKTSNKIVSATKSSL